MVDTTGEAVRGLVLSLCGSFQLRRLLVSSIELGQTSSRRRQHKRIRERNQITRGLLRSSVDLF